MRVTRLRLEGLRILGSVELEPGSGWNSLVGPNGSGKTSVLEGLFLLGHGRSFRRGNSDALIRRGEAGLSVFAEIEMGERSHRIGLTRTARDWQARIDGETVSSLGQLFKRAPVLCFEPDSHALISGAADERRRFLDWGLFHVEQDFLGVWRRYQRALKQRNALLKQSGSLPELSVWDTELCEQGGALDVLRSNYTRALQPHLESLTELLVPELGRLEIRYASGWRSETMGLADALELSRDRDRQQGNTSVGPHRADLAQAYDGLGSREHYSRGQEKLTALILRLAQARLHADRTGSWPLLLLDDLGSELDAEHLERALVTIGNMPVQRWVTGTSGLTGLQRDQTVRFHVEQGRVSRLL